MKENKINLDDYKVNYPNSIKSYKTVSDMEIPYRAISISDSVGKKKQFHVYDTTGFYTDPDYKINLKEGLPKFHYLMIKTQQPLFFQDYQK